MKRITLVNISVIALCVSIASALLAADLPYVDMPASWNIFSIIGFITLPSFFVFLATAIVAGGRAISGKIKALSSKS